VTCEEEDEREKEKKEKKSSIPDPSMNNLSSDYSQPIKLSLRHPTSITIFHAANLSRRPLKFLDAKRKREREREKKKKNESV